VEEHGIGGTNVLPNRKAKSPKRGGGEETLGPNLISDLSKQVDSDAPTKHEARA